MQLHLLRILFAPIKWAGEVVCPRKGRAPFPRITAIAAVILLAGEGFFQTLDAQQTRMVIDGSIRTEGKPLPATAKIRILHHDGTVARTVGLYDPRGYKFGIRLSAQDAFVENERILFRVVTSPQDSFLARFVGPPLEFKGTDIPSAVQTAYVLLFRNSLPTIYRWLPDTTVNEGQQIRYRTVAIDRDADTVNFSLRNAPAGATIDRITGMFYWKPTYDQSGKYTVTFLISDGYDTDSSHTASIIVRNVNRAPRFVVSLADTTIREADTLRTFVLARDPDPDIVSYIPYAVPKGMKVDSVSGAIDWIPTFDQAGRYAVRFLATDGVAYDTSRIAWLTVLNVDRPPVFVTVLGDTVVHENDSLSFSFRAIDPDGDSVWYSFKNGPLGMAMTSSGILAWRPSFTQAGSYTFIVSAHDPDTANDFEGRLRVLNTNRPPNANHLHAPSDRDTIRLALAKPVLFSWSRSIDPDSDDTIRYRVHLWGPQLDTIVGGNADTVLSINIKPHLLPLSKYWWNVIADDGYVSVPSGEVYSFKTSAGIVGSMELLSQVPKTYYLEQSLPDPFNPMITIRYALPERSYVKLAIYTMLGEPLLVLVSGDKDAGVYDVTFDATEFTSGAYMFRLDAHPLAGNQFKDFVNTKKMFIVR